MSSKFFGSYGSTKTTIYKNRGNIIQLESFRDSDGDISSYVSFNQTWFDGNSSFSQDIFFPDSDRFCEDFIKMFEWAEEVIKNRPEPILYDENGPVPKRNHGSFIFDKCQSYGITGVVIDTATPRFMIKLRTKHASNFCQYYDPHCSSSHDFYVQDFSAAAIRELIFEFMENVKSGSFMTYKHSSKKTSRMLNNKEEKDI